MATAPPTPDRLAQIVSIPSTCKNANFSFWLDITTNDPATAAYDTLKVQVLNPSGTVLSTLTRLSNLNATGGYRQYSFSLARYIGQTINLRFTGTETLGGGHITSFFEDDNALNVS